MPPDDWSGYWAAVVMLAVLASIAGLGFGMFPELGAVVLALSCLVLGLGFLWVVATFLVPAGRRELGEQLPNAHTAHLRSR
jgi:hypothetical protein